MESVDNGVCREIRPKEGENGINFIYDLRLEELSDEESKARITEMKGRSIPIWWPLCSEKVQRLIHGDNYVPQPPTGSDEFYMALLPESQPDDISVNAAINQVKTAADFKIWAGMVNQIFANGYQDIHPVNHYHWCVKGWLIPYIAFIGGTHAAVASVLNNNGVASLEFVGTLPEFRRQGLARVVSVKAVRDIFANGAKIVTLRAFYPAVQLYQSMGFHIYY
jgi:ribosomal protein S18 acetylase RimI-like enzyme